MISTLYWAWPGRSKKAHLFSEEGRSLCGGWLYFGAPMADATSEPSVDDCKKCTTKLVKLAGREQATK